ncbi:hypothetical protein FKM82_019723, partial [Ascaphus truei]
FVKCLLQIVLTVYRDASRASFCITHICIVQFYENYTFAVFQCSKPKVSTESVLTVPCFSRGLQITMLSKLPLSRDPPKSSLNSAQELQKQFILSPLGITQVLSPIRSPSFEQIPPNKPHLSRDYLTPSNKTVSVYLPPSQHEHSEFCDARQEISNASLVHPEASLDCKNASGIILTKSE